MTAVTAASVRAVLGRLPDGPEELAAAGGGVRVERGAVGKEAVEGRDELCGGDVGRAVAVERPDEGVASWTGSGGVSSP